MQENEQSNNQILPNFDMDSLSQSTQEKLSKMSLESRYREYDGMQSFMVEILEPDTDPETRLSFEDEGYDINYAGDENGFYDLGQRPKVILQTLNELKEGGVDTSRADEVFKSIATSVWQHAPSYYETRPEKYRVAKPEDYDPAVPYPKVFGTKKEDRG